MNGEEQSGEAGLGRKYVEVSGVGTTSGAARSVQAAGTEMRQPLGCSSPKYLPLRLANHRFAQDRYPYLLWVLSPPRAELYRAIDRRAHAMFEAGLEVEVRHLVSRGIGEAPPMRSVGYAQGLALVEGRLSREQAIQQAARETRRYAKRQLTWFRKKQGARWIEPPYQEPFEPPP